MSFDHFCIFRVSGSESGRRFPAQNKPNSETGDAQVDGYPLYMPRVVTFLHIIDIPVTYESLLASETGMCHTPARSPGGAHL